MVLPQDAGAGGAVPTSFYPKMTFLLVGASQEGKWGKAARAGTVKSVRPPYWH
jgi:hypothetical protein